MESLVPLTNLTKNKKSKKSLVSTETLDVPEWTNMTYVLDELYTVNV